MQKPIETALTPGLLRRLAAMFYDIWLIVGLWFLGATADYAIRSALGASGDFPQLPLQLYLLGAPLLFFGWFWTHGGQTLGMRAWQIQLLASNGGLVSWRQALIRFAAAVLSATALGLGYLWILFDPERLAWHDRLSGTRLVILRKT